jgi:transcription elongation factor GreA
MEGMVKKNILTYAGLKKLEDELENLKTVRRKEVAAKISEAREQGDLSENAEYDAAKEEQAEIAGVIKQLVASNNRAIYEELEQKGAVLQEAYKKWTDYIEHLKEESQAAEKSGKNEKEPAAAKLPRSLEKLALAYLKSGKSIKGDKKDDTNGEDSQ